MAWDVGVVVEWVPEVGTGWGASLAWRLLGVAAVVAHTVAGASASL